MKKLFVTTFLTVAIAVLGLQAAVAQQRFSRAALVADLDTLVSTIEEVHPDPYTVVKKKQFYKEVARVKAGLRDSMTRSEFYLEIAPLTASLGDGHTGVYFIPDDRLTQNSLLFPYAVMIEKRDTSVVVILDGSSLENTIPVKSRILSINGIATRTIIERMASYFSGEQFNFRLESLNYQHFIFLMYSLYPADEFDIVYRDPQGNTHTKTTPAVSFLTFAEIFRQRREAEPPASPQRQYYYELAKVDTAANVAVIDFRNFKGEDQVRPFLDSTFTVLKERNIGNLVIDIRNNGGGNSAIGDEFFQYISPVPFKQYGEVDVKVSRFKAKGYEENVKEGEIIHYAVEELNPLRDNPLRYTGKVYLLTGNRSFSSAADFAWAFHYFKMGTIVGEETGGLIDSFGDVCYLKLPNTKIDYGVSFKKFTGYGSNGKQFHGVYPDVEVSAEQAMTKALELIAAVGQ